MENLKINIKKDFTDSPGPRNKEDGPHSGQEFLEEILRPQYLKALNNKVKLIIELDGVWGYPYSFVSGSFGKLSQERGTEEVLDTIIFVSNDNAPRLKRIISEIKDPLRLETV